jgi:hypothetical protein
VIGNKKLDANSIPYSQAVTHPGTNGTRRCLDFGELTRPGAFSVVWPLTPTHCSTQTKVQLQLYYSYLSLIYIYRGRPDPRISPLLTNDGTTPSSTPANSIPRRPCMHSGGRFNGSLAVKTPPTLAANLELDTLIYFFLFPTTLHQSRSLSLSIDSYRVCIASNKYSTILFWLRRGSDNPTTAVRP